MDRWELVGTGLRSLEPAQIAAAAALVALSITALTLTVLLVRRQRTAAARNEELARAQTQLQERDRQLAAIDRERAAERAAADALRERLIERERQQATLAQALEDAKRAATGNEERLRESFAALSSEALRRNNQFFMELAQSSFAEMQRSAASELDSRQAAIQRLVGPIQESLGRVDSQLQRVEKERQGHYQEITKHMELVALSQRELGASTSRLVQALRRPHVRGRWGEIQLRRVIEMAGMLAHCDFYEQPSTESEQGRLRPDVVVQLPGRKQVVVDAKTPLDAYLSAIEAEDEAERGERMRDHARQVRAHMDALSRRAYWDQFSSSPEFVVMFLPGETFFSSALEWDPSLLESGVEQRVLVASPTTLIALLRAVAYGWRQERITENAEEISKLGRELYGRLSKLSDHFSRLGRQIGSVVTSYNQLTGSLESRVMSAARRFHDLGATAHGDLSAGERVTQSVRGAREGELPLQISPPEPEPE